MVYIDRTFLIDKNDFQLAGGGNLVTQINYPT